MVYNIVTASFGASKKATTRTLYQYDYGVKLRLIADDLPSMCDVHFCNTGDDSTLEVPVDEGFADIPDRLLETGKTIVAYVYVHTGDYDGETAYEVTIPVKARPRPSENVDLPVNPNNPINA